jgi:hypothetical protein
MRMSAAGVAYCCRLRRPRVTRRRQLLTIGNLNVLKDPVWRTKKRLSANKRLFARRRQSSAENSPTMIRLFVIVVLREENRALRSLGGRQPYATSSSHTALHQSASSLWYGRIMHADSWPNSTESGGRAKAVLALTSWNLGG